MTPVNPGAAFRAKVRTLLEDRGYEFVSKDRFFAACILSQPIYSQKCEIGKDMYGKPRRPHFVLHHPRLWKDNLIIQCKWQESSGTTEEKFPFEVKSIAINQIPAIVVLDGGGYSPNAKQWLLNQAGKNNLLHVFSLQEMTKFVTQGRL